jgi:hypothetical protein
MIDNSSQYLTIMCSIMDGCEAIHGPWTHRSERYAEMAAPLRRVIAPGISRRRTIVKGRCNSGHG